MSPRLLAVLLACAAILPARASPVGDDLWTQPAGAVAWWVFDPRPAGGGIASDPMRALGEAGLRALLARALPVEPAPPISLATLLTPGVLGGPYRLCLLEISARDSSSRPGPDDPADLTRFAAVLEIRAPGGHERFAEAVRASLAPGVQERGLELPGGLPATAAARPADAASEVSWASTPDAFLVGFGPGALERWLQAQAAPAGTEAAAARAQIAARRQGATPVLEAFVDLDALRAGVPEQFAYGRLGRLADAWRISNARMVMATVGLARAAPDRPPLLEADIAFSSRAERPGTVRSMPITRGSWPEDWNEPVAPAPYAAVLRADWQNWIMLAMDTWAACSPRSGSRIIAARDPWFRRHGRALDRLAARAGTWVVVRGGADGEFVRAQLNPGDKPARNEADVREVFGDLGERVWATPGGVWSLTLDADQADADRLLRRFFWGFSRSGAAVVAGWSAGPVEAAAGQTP